MSTINNLGNPGILYPHMRYRFNVRFLDKDLNKLDVSDQLARQVMSFSGVHEVFGIIPRSCVTFVFQDDLTNRAFKGLLELKKLDSFIVAIDMLCGDDTTVRTTFLKNAWAESFYHSNLDYAGSEWQTDAELKIKLDNKLGEIRDLLDENPASAAIITALSGASIEVVAGRKQVHSVACELNFKISFDELEYEFYQKDSG